MTTSGHEALASLSDAWKRMEIVCTRLWNENSPTAVEAQAALEEFKGAVHRGDAYLSNVVEQRAHDLRNHEDSLASLRRQYEMEMAGLKRRIEGLEHALREKDLRNDELLKAIANKEEQNLEFHSQLLRMSATGDEAKARKMDEFYQELLKKESSLEESWEQRHKALEQEHSHFQNILSAKQAQLDAWEERRIAEEEAIKKRSTDLEIKSQHLFQEYRKKQQEIEELKSSLQHSITELVRQYQSRVKNESGQAAR
jgi:predicted  nucleic acid-binding Zn-ribbon protein